MPESIPRLLFLALLLSVFRPAFAQSDPTVSDDSAAVVAEPSRSLFEKIIEDRPLLHFLQGVPIYNDNLDYSMRLGGRIHMDANTFEGVYSANQDGRQENNIFRRRVAIELQGLLGKNWDYKVQAIGDENTIIDTSGDFYVNYHGKGLAALVRIGKAKEPMGLEALTTSNAITATERTAATNAFAPGRNVGVTFYGTLNEYKYGIGVYHNNNTKDNQGQNYAITGRLAKPIVLNSKRVVHVGASFSHRKGKYNRLLLYPEVREVLQSNRISSGTIDTQGVNILNLEWLYIDRALHMSGEAYAARYEGDDNSRDGVDGKTLNAYGSYVTVGYFLTGETRPYNALYGGFNIIVPRDKQIGAWEVFSRLSHIDLRDNSQGNEAYLFTAGVNWYLTRNFRFMFDYSHAEYDKSPDGQGATGVIDDSAIDTGGNALTARFQFAY